MWLEAKYWETKSLLEMNEVEWEALCDGCGKCCYRKFIEGSGKRQKLYFTRIACNLLNIETGKCANYKSRFKQESDCTKLTKKNLPDFEWLPKTCAYRYDWHPLISQNSNSVKLAGIFIENGIHERDIIDWFEFIVDEDH